MKRYLKYSTIAVFAAVAVTWVADYTAARTRRNPFSDVQIDRMYAMNNRWGDLEYSVGKGVTQRCVHSLFPHFGFNPCWYVNRQSLTYVRVG